MLKFLLGTTAHFYAEAGADGSAGGGAASGAEGAGASGGEGAGGKADPAPGAGATPLAFLPNATPEQVAYAQAKGWDKASNPAEAIFNSYQNLEKVFGADKAGNTIILPGENADAKTLDAFQQKLGRPATVDKYSADTWAGMPEGVDAGLKEAAFKAGLSEKQYAAMRDWNNTTDKAFREQLAADGKIEFAQQEAALRKEWGAAYQEKVALGSAACKEMGWTDDQVNAMQMALGFDGVMKLAAALGEKVGEGQFIGGQDGRSSGGTGAMTPAQAKAELSKLTTDAAFMKAWQDKTDIGHAAAVAKKSQLSKWANGEK